MRFTYNKPDYAQIIKDAVTVEDVIKRYHKLGHSKKRTSCPFHNGTHDNLSYNKKTWHCFKCEEKGDVITFVEKLFRLNFMGAVRRIADDFNIHLDIESAPEDAQKSALAKLAREAAKAAKDRCKQYDTYVAARLREYYWWLNSLSSRNEIINEQMSRTGSMIDRSIFGTLHIDYDIDAMIKSMGRTVLSSLGYNDTEIKLMEESK